MSTIGIIACLLGFVLVIFLAYKNFSPFIASCLGALFVIIFTGSPVTETLTMYAQKCASFAAGYWLVFLFGAIMARLYAESGAAMSIAVVLKKSLLRDSMKASTRQFLALLVINLIPGIMGMGGIITSVALLLCYPLALSIFETCDIPKRFSYTALALGCFSWCIMVPGAVQTTNIMPQSFLGTDALACLIPGWAGGVVWAVGGTVILNILINRAKAKGEKFEYGPNDKRFEESDNLPNFWLSLLPLIVVFVVYNICKVNINITLGIGALLTLVLNWKYLKPIGILPVLNAGAAQAIAPMATVGAMVGFANVVTSTEAFSQITNLLFSIPMPPVLLVIIFCGVIAGLTGGSGTGFLVSLPILAPALLAQGVDPEMIHRVGLFAGTAISMLPYSGVILMFLPISGLKLKDIYGPVFWTMVVWGLVSTAVVVLCWGIGL